MTFIHEILIEPGMTQSLLLLTLTITLGLWLSEHARIRQFSMGITWVLFAGILLSACGLRMDSNVARFAKELGLVLFIYSVGIQAGPSFSFSKSTIRLNIMALAIVLGGTVVALLMAALTHTNIATMTGILSGAVVSTPSLGAAEQAYRSIFHSVLPDIATGYALAYPMGILAVILSYEILRRVLKIDLHNEDQKLRNQSLASQEQPLCVDITLRNPQITSLTLAQLQRLCPVKMVVSRVIRPDGTDEMVNATTTFGNGDIIRVLTDKAHIETLGLLGQMHAFDLQENKEVSQHLISRRIVVTKPECNGKQIASFDIRNRYHATITRVNRAGFDLLATPDLVLQLGDRIMVVGDKSDIQRVADTFGNELKRLDLPHLLPIFFGLALGIVIGSVSFVIPGTSQTLQLGLAGGCLIVALLIGRFGPYYNMVTFATTSANMMLRQVGLSLFLAAVGLSVGNTFIPAITAGGYMWVVYGFVIALVPLVAIGWIAYRWFHFNYFTIIGVMTGAVTAAPALDYANTLSDNNDQVAVCYATVYPLTLFLRVMLAQILIIFFCAS